MKRSSQLLTVAAAVLLATGAVRAQPVTPGSPAAPTMPAEAQPATHPALEQSPQPTSPTAAPSPMAGEGPADPSAVRDTLRNERMAADTELKRTSREAAAAQRAVMANRTGGELSTPQQDRGGLAGLGSEAEPARGAMTR